MPGETLDFGSLAARLAVNLDEVRVCLLMSRDGLTLGVYPKEEEELGRSVWDRLQSVGNPERGFFFVGDELWIVTRRGPYVGVVVASPSATPGLLLDRLESILRSAEELRQREGSAAPREATRRPRTPLHPEPEPEAAAPQPVAADALTVDISEPVAAGEVTDPIKAALQFATMQGGGPTEPLVPADAPEPAAPEPPGPPDSPEPSAPDTSEPSPSSIAAPPPNFPAEGPAPVQGSVGAPPTLPPTEAPPAATDVDAPRFEPIAAKPSAPPPAPEPPAPPPEPPPAPPEPEPDEPEPAPEKPERRYDAEVDPVALAREFSMLTDDDDG